MSKGWEGGSDTRWRRLRAAILLRDKGLCTIAAQGCLGTADQVDHIIPLHMGGAKYDPTNCRAACAPCNLGRKRTHVREEPPHRRVSSW
jgi:5-methylcytosine-specific restriction endonuclease McrA